MNFSLFIFHYCRAEGGGQACSWDQKSLPEGSASKHIVTSVPQEAFPLSPKYLSFPASWEEPRRAPGHPSGRSNLHDLLCHTVSNQQLCTHGWCTGGRSLERCKYWWHRLENSCVASVGSSSIKQTSQRSLKSISRRRKEAASSQGNLWWLVLQGEFPERLVARGRGSTLAWTARGHEKRRKTSGCYIKSTSVHSLEW